MLCPPPPAAFFFNDTATTEIYTLSLHDALPISSVPKVLLETMNRVLAGSRPASVVAARSEEHTSELQSPVHLVCRLLLEKKKSQASTNHCPVLGHRFRSRPARTDAHS